MKISQAKDLTFKFRVDHTNTGKMGMDGEAVYQDHFSVTAWDSKGNAWVRFVGSTTLFNGEETDGEWVTVDDLGIEAFTKDLADRLNEKASPKLNDTAWISEDALYRLLDTFDFKF